MYNARRADCWLALLLPRSPAWLLRPESITFAPRLGRSLARYMLLKQWRIVVMQDADQMIAARRKIKGFKYSSPHCQAYCLLNDSCTQSIIT